MKFFKKQIFNLILKLNKIYKSILVFSKKKKYLFLKKIKNEFFKNFLILIIKIKFNIIIIIIIKILNNLNIKKKINKIMLIK